MAVLIYGCATSESGVQQVDEVTQRIVVSGTHEQVFYTAAEVARQMGWSVAILSSANSGVIRARYDGDLSMLGDQVFITVDERSDGIGVTVRSTFGDNLNRRYIRDYLETVALSV